MGASDRAFYCAANRSTAARLHFHPQEKSLLPAKSKSNLFVFFIATR